MLGIPVPVAVAVSAGVPDDSSRTSRPTRVVVRALKHEFAHTPCVRRRRLRSRVEDSSWLASDLLSTTRPSLVPTNGRGSSFPCLFRAPRCRTDRNRSFERRRSPSRMPSSHVPRRFRHVAGFVLVRHGLDHACMMEIHVCNTSCLADVANAASETIERGR